MKLAVILIFVAVQLFNFLLKFLDYSKRNEELPQNVSDVYDEKTYHKRNAYQMEKLRLGIVSGVTSMILTLAYLIFDFHSLLFDFISLRSQSVHIQAFFMLGVIMLISLAVSTVFDVYETFHIEEKYGFNKSTAKIFISDLIKQIILFAVLMGGLLSLFLTLYFAMDSLIFLIFSIIVVFFSFCASFLYPYFSRLFNKFSPLEDGTLKEKINAFAAASNFPVKKIFVMNASKRTTKLNAYFSGTGKSKVIVLYDTLVQKLTEDEILAVLAHEMGHAKKRHTLLNTFLSIITIAIFAFVAQYIVINEAVSAAFGFANLNIAFGIYIFFMVVAPLSIALSIPQKYISRRFEYAADKYAAQHIGKEPMISALKQLARCNYSNLTPHKVVVAIKYSHPPLTQRINALEKISDK